MALEVVFMAFKVAFNPFMAVTVATQARGFETMTILLTSQRVE